MSEAIYKHSGEALPALWGVGTGINLANGRIFDAAVIGVVGGYFTYADRRDRQKLAAKEIAEARTEGYSDGVSKSVDSLIDLASRQLDPNAPPFYTSADGSVQIQTPLELLQSLGSSPEAIVTRVGVILRHYDKRDLTRSEYETLRKVRILIDYSNLDHQRLPPEDENFIEDINGAIFDWEMQQLRRQQDERRAELRQRLLGSR